MFQIHRSLRCSFCRKSESEVAKLVAGPRVLICDACVAIAARLMDGDSPAAHHTGADAQPAWRTLVRGLRRWFDQHSVAFALRGADGAMSKTA